jgi:hypothetical protein
MASRGATSIRAPDAGTHVVGTLPQVGAQRIEAAQTGLRSRSVANLVYKAVVRGRPRPGLRLPAVAGLVRWRYLGQRPGRPAGYERLAADGACGNVERG